MYWIPHMFQPFSLWGARWLSVRMLDSGLRVCWSSLTEHCVVSLSKILYPLLITACIDMTEKCWLGRKESNQTNNMSQSAPFFVVISIWTFLRYVKWIPDWDLKFEPIFKPKTLHIGNHFPGSCLHAENCMYTPMFILLMIGSRYFQSDVGYSSELCPFD